MTYNGWETYETWLVELWLTNDEPTYHEMQSLTRNARNAYSLADAIKEYVEDNNPLADDASLYADLISATISECDFVEIAEHWIADYEADNPPTGSKNNPAEYKMEVEIPGNGELWLAYDPEGDEISLHILNIDYEPLMFWDAFEDCIQHAIDHEYTSIIIKWLVSERDVAVWNMHRTNTLIDKQSSRSARKDA